MHCLPAVSKGNATIAERLGTRRVITGIRMVQKTKDKNVEMIATKTSNASIGRRRVIESLIVINQSRKKRSRQTLVSIKAMGTKIIRMMMKKVPTVRLVWDIDSTS